MIDENQAEDARCRPDKSGQCRVHPMCELTRKVFLSQPPAPLPAGEGTTLAELIMEVSLCGGGVLIRGGDAKGWYERVRAALAAPPSEGDGGRTIQDRASAWAAWARNRRSAVGEDLIDFLDSVAASTPADAAPPSEPASDLEEIAKYIEHKLLCGLAPREAAYRIRAHRCAPTSETECPPHNRLLTADEWQAIVNGRDATIARLMDKYGAGGSSPAEATDE